MNTEDNRKKLDK
ncbi:hypothetical protein AX774_g501, partial [Zancudomyces culisetae]